jgi:hypothetical protein
MARRRNFRPPKKTMLIICEGETEINLKPELPGPRNDCLGIVEKAIKKKDEYDQVKSKLPDAIENSVRAARYNSENKIINGTRSDVYKIVEKILPGLKMLIGDRHS